MRRQVPFAVWIFLLAAILGYAGSNAAQAAACTGWCAGGDGTPTSCRHHLFFGGICINYGTECYVFECSAAIPNTDALDRLAHSAVAPGNASVCPAPVEQVSSPLSRVARVEVLEARL